MIDDRHDSTKMDRALAWLPQSVNKDLLINEIIPTTPSGEVLFTSLGGQFILSIESSDSTWKIAFTWLSP